MIRTTRRNKIDAGKGGKIEVQRNYLWNVFSSQIYQQKESDCWDYAVIPQYPYICLMMKNKNGRE